MNCRIQIDFFAFAFCTVMEFIILIAFHSTYHPRSDARKLCSQYFQYGLYKPLVLKKIKSEIKLRHLIPSAFVFYLLLLLPLFFMEYTVAIAPLLLYIMLACYYSLLNTLSLKAKWCCLLIYPILHISYGSGFIIGLNKK